MSNMFRYRGLATVWARLAVASAVKSAANVVRSVAVRYATILVVVVLGFLGVACSGQGGVIDVKPFKFAYLADIHISDGTSSVEDLEASVADMNSQKDLDFAILAGDITEFGSDQEILKAKHILDNLSIPYYIIAGNHDSKWSESGCNTFAKVFGYEVFDFEFNGVKFIGTNSGPNMRMAPALVPRESMVWLDSVSAAVPKNMPVIFVNHYPLDNAMLNYQDVLGFLSRMNTQLSMCGHGHNNNALDFSGLRGAMGRSNLRAGKRAHGQGGYNIVTVAGDSLFMAERSGGVIEKRSDTMVEKGSDTVCVPWVTKEPWFAIELVPRENNPFVYENRAEMAQEQVSNAQVNKAEVANLPLSVVWEFQDNSDIGSAPAMEFGLVYISNSAGFVKALDASNGALIWSYKTGGKIFSSPAVHVPSGVLVVGSSDNNIYGIDARTGALRWKTAANKSVLGSPTIFNNIAYIGASDGIFRALDVATGELVWSYDKIAGFIESKPWVDSQGVYVGDWANRVYAFDPVTGELQWEWNNNKGRGLSAAAVWPVKANGKVFVVTPERKVHALDAATGRELWSAKGGREAIGLSDDGFVAGSSNNLAADGSSNLAADGSNNVAADGSAIAGRSNDPTAVYIKTMQDTVIAFSTGNYKQPTKNNLGKPNKIWESHAGYGYEIAPSPITAAYGLVFIPTDKGNIFALNAIDGTVAWQYNFSIALINYVRPVNHNQLLVTSMDGKVALLQL